MPSVAKPVLLYFYYKRSSFIAKDIHSLTQRYAVVEFALRTGKMTLAVDLLRQLYFILRNWRKSGIFLCFFAGYHSFIPALIARLSGKKCLIVAGGTDCVSFPLISYGNFVRQPLKLITCLSFRMADSIAPVHERLIYYPYSYESSMPAAQGIMAHCPGITTPVTAIHNGYDPEYFKPGGQKARRTFLTVAYGIGTRRINELKGIDLILKTAPVFPDCIFNLVGRSGDDFPVPVPANVRLFPQADQETLLKFYRGNEYYMQFSLSEGFPNSLSEAMLCGCVPLGSDTGGIPDIIGDTGFILNNRDSNQLKSIIQQALAANTPQLGEAARERIISCFPAEKRTLELLDWVGKYQYQ